MAKTAAYWQKGDSLDYTNKTDQTIPAGTPCWYSGNGWEWPGQRSRPGRLVPSM